MNSPRYLTLVQDLLTLIQQRPAVSRSTDAAAQRHLKRRVRRRWRQLETKVARLEADGGDAALHKARIATKRCRAAFEALAPMAGADVARTAKALAKLQDALGAAHDAAVIETWLRTADESPGAFVAGELAISARTEGTLLTMRWPKVWAKAQHRYDRT